MKSFNGVDIGKITKEAFQDLHKKKYQYSIIQLTKKARYISNIPNEGSIAIIDVKNKKPKIKINNKEIDVKKNNFLSFKLNKLIIESNCKITIGIAGIKKKIKKNIIKKFKEKEIYKVIKHWGYELWINGQVPTYSFKKIFIKKGNRTSLQYHKKKFETNFLFKGNALMTLSKKSGKAKKEEIIKNLYMKKISSGNFVNVNNYAIHRIKAVSDIILYEVSTPHLDDVIRLVDDKKRKDGRIFTEHLKDK